MIQYEKVLKECMDKDDSIMLMTAENRAALRNLSTMFPDRFVDTGITEQAMIGIAAGLALRGRKPVAHALASFLTMRAFEFIRTDVGIPNLPVKVVGFVPGILSDGNGPTHQAIEDVSLMRGIPNMQVFAPADHEEMCIGLPEIMKSDAPTYIRMTLNSGKYEHSKDFAIGKSENLFMGEDVCILTYGAMFEHALAAREQLKSEGIDAGLLNLRMLKPLDEASVMDAVNRAKLVVTVEDHFITGGLASILAELLVKKQTMKPVHNIGFNEKWFQPATLDQVLEHEKMTGPHLAERIKIAFKEQV